MNAYAELAPGIPGDYYRRIYDAELVHFWYRGMWTLAARLLGERMHRGRLLDAGCGTGGFLRFALEEGDFSSVAGADLAGGAIAFARERVPEAELHVAPLRSMPFPDQSFDLVVSNDVLQHVPEADVQKSLLEIRRLLAPGGVVLLRTNGSRRLRRERDDWRAYDASTLRRELGVAGFRVLRVTHANAVLSLLGAARGRVPHAPSEEAHGIPTRRPNSVVSRLGALELAAEARLVKRGFSIPYGHTLFGLAEAT